MQKVVSLIAFGKIAKGDVIATFTIHGLANRHYWVMQGWAEVQ